jgi:ABC-2 type transport system ATP-binding protein
LTLQLESPLAQMPPTLGAYGLDVAKGGNELIYTYEGDGGRTDIIALLKALDDAGIRFRDLHTTQSSLEDIFVSLLRGNQ